VTTKRVLFWGLLAASSLLAACGHESNRGDVATPDKEVAVGVNRFLLFPDPIVLPDGSYETNTAAYAQAYYRAIDPNNQKDTLEKWKAANGFGSGTGAEHLAVFRDVRDLGYGRRMTGRKNSDGSIAFMVENYSVTVTPSSGYNGLNVDAAIGQDARWHVGTNAIEWSTATCTPEDPPDCDPTVRFAKYYNFSATTGERQLAVDLDGKGLKAMPGPCVACHGGRADALTPPDAATGNPRFALVENSSSRKRGDTEGRLQGLNVGSFEYSGWTGWTRADQAAVLKDFNQWVLCTYPLPATATPDPEDACRSTTTNSNEWQGTAAEIIKSWYGGPGMPSTTFSDTYVPAGWSTNTPIGTTGLTDTSLYQEVVGPYCRTCHAVRGTGDQSDIDFMSLAKFQGYADRIKAHVFDRGNMPMALIPHDDFWNSPAPQALATYIDFMLGANSATDSGGAPLKPGRPIADPGPDRMVRTSTAAPLSAANSLFASSYAWSVTGTPSGGSATINNPTSADASFIATLAGDYTVQLTVSDGTTSDTKTVTVTADDNFPDPATIKFAQVKNVLQKTSTCTTCHTVTAVPQPANTPPVWYADFDRNGDGTTDATDDAWLREAVLGRVNLTDVTASPLLRKPTGNHHAGLAPLDLGTVTGLRDYSILYDWILAGSPPGGVVANAGADSSNQVTFGGSPLAAAIALDGLQSVGTAGATLSYTWSIVSAPPDGPGGAPSISGANSAAATLNVTNVGVYVVQLQVTDGTDTDTAQRVITVTETPIVASFTPATGNQFLSSVPAGISLNNTSSGSPTVCQWQVVSGSATLSSTSSCATTTLNVPAYGTYSVQLMVSNISSSSATNTLTVSSTAPTASLTNTATPVSKSFASSGGNMSFLAYQDVLGTTPTTNIAVPIVTASVALDGSTSTTPIVATLSYSWCLSGQPDAAKYPASIAVCPLQTSSGNSSTISMTVRATGTYAVNLTVNNGSGSNTTSKVVTVTPTRGVKFTDVVTTLNDTVNVGCTGCHTSGGTAYYNPISNDTNNFNYNPPSWVDELGSESTPTTLYQRIMQRVNLATPTNSLLLLNPSNDQGTTINTNGHGGGCLPGFDIWGAGGTGTPWFCPDTSSANYNNFLKWIQDGAPPGN